jgi:hypothetical protein
MKFIISLALFTLLAACGSSTETEEPSTDILDNTLNITLTDDTTEEATTDTSTDSPAPTTTPITTPTSPDETDETEPSDEIDATTKVSTQNFESFHTGNDWYLTDFGLTPESTRSDYRDENGNILFDILWTKRTRNLMADRLGYARDQMNQDLASDICTPKLEVGKPVHMERVIHQI